MKQKSLRFFRSRITDREKLCVCLEPIHQDRLGFTSTHKLVEFSEEQLLKADSAGIARKLALKTGLDTDKPLVLIFNTSPVFYCHLINWKGKVQTKWTKTEVQNSEQFVSVGFSTIYTSVLFWVLFQSQTFKLLQISDSQIFYSLFSCSWLSLRCFFLRGTWDLLYWIMVPQMNVVFFCFNASWFEFFSPADKWKNINHSCGGQWETK